MTNQTPSPQATKHTQDLHRLLRMLMLIQGEPGWGPKRLSDEFGVTQRTVYRDIDKLRATGFQVEHDRSRGGYRITGDRFLQPVQLTPDEALAMAVLVGRVTDADGLGVLSPASRAVTKLIAQLPAEVREEVEEATLHTAVHAGPSVPSDDHADVYHRVRDAIAKRRALDCEYEPVGREAQRFRFEPYELFFRGRAWYAVGKRYDRDTLRSMKLARFVNLSPTDEAYRIPKGFSAEAFLGNAWQLIRGEPTARVELLFDADIAERVTETRWHPTQEVEARDDGSATFRCTVDGLDEIVWWILSMGPSVRVIAPAELADRVKSLAIETAERYGHANTAT